jgi:hypothetical protein
MLSLEARIPQAKRFLSQNTVHMILRVEMVCLNFFFIGDDVPLFHGLRATPMCRPCDYEAQEVIALLTVSCQKTQRIGLPFYFVFIHKHLRHPA